MMQSRFGDKPHKIEVVCPPQRDCGPKRVKLELAKEKCRAVVNRWSLDGYLVLRQGADDNIS